MSVTFRRCVRHLATAKCSLLWWCRKRCVELASGGLALATPFLLLLLFSLIFSGFKPALPKLKGVMSFCLCIKFDPRSFHCYLFCFEFFYFIFFVSIVSLNIWFHLILILSLVVILMITICFVLNPFRNWFFFSISYLSIWFHFIFISNLVIIFFNLYLFWFGSFFIELFSQSHPLTHLASWFFRFVFYGIIFTSWLGSRVWKVNPSWLWSFFFKYFLTIDFFSISLFNIEFVGDWAFWFFFCLNFFYGIVSFSYLELQGSTGWLNYTCFFIFLFMFF